MTLVKYRLRITCLSKHGNFSFLVFNILSDARPRQAVELVRKWVDKGMAIREIAALLDISVQEVRRLSKNGRR
jgi:hypothetical protein